MSSPPTNLVLIVLDSVRADRFYNYVDNEKHSYLGGDIIGRRLYKHAYTTGSWTVPAHGSLFTGKPTFVHGAHSKNKKLEMSPEETLAGKISKLGYQTVGFSTNPWISTSYGFDTGFQDFNSLRMKLPYQGESVDPRDVVWERESGISKWFERLQWLFKEKRFQRIINSLYRKTVLETPILPAEQVNKEILSWIENKKEKSVFMFVNYMDAHEPYRIRDEFLDSNNIDEESLNHGWNLHSLKDPPKAEMKTDVQKIYDASVKYLLFHLDKLMARFDDLDLLHDTKFVILSDHGQALGEKGYWGHGTLLLKELIHVPLIELSPENANVTVKKPVSITEVPQMIMDDIEEQVDSQKCHSFSPFAEERNFNPIYAESLGPHQNVSEIPDWISKEGYRLVVVDQRLCVQHIEDDEIYFTEYNPNEGLNINHVNQTTSDLKVLNELIDEYGEAHSNDDGDKKLTQQLQDLGYI